MTHIKDAKPEPLTAEQEAVLRRQAYLVDHTYRLPGGGWFHADIDHIWAALDAARADLAALQQVIDQQAEHLHAARAETEAVRRELGNEIAVLEVRATTAAFDLQQLRALAAELVEGLAGDWAQKLWSFLCLEFEALPDSGEVVTADIRPHFNALCNFMQMQSDLIARARALGIGGEKPHD
jgi:hypothetical protein